MRCWQARKKLNQSEPIESLLAENSALSEHVNHCPACAAFVQAARALKRDLSLARPTDHDHAMSISELKAAVEQRAAQGHTSQVKEYSLMATFSRSLRRRPKLSFGLAVAALFLIAAMLVPFSYNKTVGYEVAFAGVDKNLAMDSDKIQHLLIKLGVDNAKFDVSDCTETCNLKIYDLKSTDDVKLIAAAFDEIGNVIRLDDIKEVCEDANGNIFHKITFDLLHEGSGNIEFYSIDEAHKLLSQKFGDSLKAELNIWMSQDGSTLDITHKGLFFSDSNMVLGDDEGKYQIVIDKLCDGAQTENKLKLQVINDDGTTEFIDLPDGELDAETKAKLEAMGIDMQVLADCGGGNSVQTEQKMIFIGKKDTSLSPDETPTDEAAAKTLSGEIPETYGLAQNYPNPFNPTTTINYTLPQAQFVALDVFNINGQKVKTLVNDIMSAGEHQVEWDATNDAGSTVASGVYLYKLTAGDFTETKKMSFLK